MNAATLWTDGGAKGNPGPAAAGYVLQQEGTLIEAVGIFLGEPFTNNEAEYWALLLALHRALQLGYTRLHVHTDSRLLAEQVNGRWKVKTPRLRPFLMSLRMMRSTLPFEVQWVPREQNTLADRLVRAALKHKRTVRYDPVEERILPVTRRGP